MAYVRLEPCGLCLGGLTHLSAPHLGVSGLGQPPVGCAMGVVQVGSLERAVIPVFLLACTTQGLFVFINPSCAGKQLGGEGDG